MIWNWKLPTINFPGEKCIGLRGINPKLHHPSSKGVLHWNFNACVVAEGCLANGHTIILQPQHIYYYLAFFTCWLAFMVKSQTYRLERKFADRPFSDGLLCYNEYLSTVYILRLQYALHFSMIKTKTQSTAK